MGEQEQFSIWSYPEQITEQDTSAVKMMVLRTNGWTKEIK